MRGDSGGIYPDKNAKYPFLVADTQTRIYTKKEGESERKKMIHSHCQLWMMPK